MITNIQEYISKLKIWQAQSEVEEEKQAALVWLNLPRDHHSDIKKIIIENISREEFQGKDGMDRLIIILMEVFMKEEDDLEIKEQEREQRG